MKSFRFVVGIVSILACICACRSGVSETKSDIDSLQTGLFGTIPQVYEDEMLKLTELGLSVEANGDSQGLKRTFGDLADSAYQEAEKKAKSQMIKMIGRTVEYTQEEGLGYRIKSKIKILSTFPPELRLPNTHLRVAIQFTAEADTTSQPVYYILSGSEGDVCTGYFTMRLDSASAPFATMIKAPNVPARYLLQTKIRFVSASTYNQLKDKLYDQQKKWREIYRDVHGLQQMNSIE